MSWLFFGADGVMPGVEEVEWVEDPDWENSPASKFVQRYSRHLIGYHFRMPIYRQDRWVYDGCHPLQQGNELT